MNSKMLFVTFLVVLFTFSFVSAQECSTFPFHIIAISPANGAILETSEDNLNVRFDFSIEIDEGCEFRNQDFEWFIDLDGNYLNVTWADNTHGFATKTLPIKEGYWWSVLSMTREMMTFTDPTIFSIIRRVDTPIHIINFEPVGGRNGGSGGGGSSAPIIVNSTPTNPAPIAPTPIADVNSTPTNPAPIEGGTSGGGNNGGSSGGGSGSSGNRGRNNDDQGGRRKPAGNLTLEELSTNSSQTEQNEESPKEFSITGAVIGVLGKKGALGLGILFVVAGVAGFLIYNRKRFGLVKKSE